MRRERSHNPPHADASIAAGKGQRAPIGPGIGSGSVAVAWAILSCVGLCGLCSAQIEDPTPAPESTPENTPKNTPTDADSKTGPLPSLDELLGLAGDEAVETDDATSEPAMDPALDQQAQSLERKLTAQEAADELSQAIQLMDDTAARLAQPGGTGLTTQRLQEDILRKLDMLISNAEQNKGQGSGKSSGSKSSQSSPSSAPGSQQSGAQAMSSQGQGDTESMPSAGTDAALGPQRLLDASAWGSLPDRLREALQQGLNEPFSAAYRSLTESYYRKLAEEAEDER